MWQLYNIFAEDRNASEATGRTDASASRPLRPRRPAPARRTASRPLFFVFCLPGALLGGRAPYSHVARHGCASYDKPCSSGDPRGTEEVTTYMYTKVIIDIHIYIYIYIYIIQYNII